MKSAKAKAIISTLLIVTALYSMSSGAVLYFLDYGMWLGLTRKFIKDSHALSALIMGFGIIAHLVLNWRLYAREIKTALKKNL